YVLSDDPDADPGRLRQALRGVLPDPLVPAVIVVLDELPPTPSGKLDRRALPAPSSGTTTTTSVAEPTPDLQALPPRPPCEVLGLAQVGIDDDFFALGGHSLSATRVAARLGERLATDVPVRWLFEHPTIAGLAAVLGDAVPRAQSIEVAGIATELTVQPRD